MFACLLGMDVLCELGRSSYSLSHVVWLSCAVLHHGFDVTKVTYAFPCTSLHMHPFYFTSLQV
jgi:hypothetical protein